MITDTADDNATYVIRKTMKEILQELEKISHKFFMWFTENEIMANTDKDDFRNSFYEDHTIEINGYTVKQTHNERNF